MENKLAPEIFEKCKKAVLNAKSADEIQAFAKQNGIEMTAETAADWFDRYHKSGELSDNELDNVAGGGCGEEQKYYCKTCGHELMVFDCQHFADSACPVCEPEKVKFYENLTLNHLR